MKCKLTVQKQRVCHLLTTIRLHTEAHSHAHKNPAWSNLIILITKHVNTLQMWLDFCWLVFCWHYRCLPFLFFWKHADVKDSFHLLTHITLWCLISITPEPLSILQTRTIPVWTLQAHRENALGLDWSERAHVLYETLNCVSGLQSGSGGQFSQKPVPKTRIYLPIPDSRAETKDLPW